MELISLRHDVTIQSNAATSTVIHALAVATPHIGIHINSTTLIQKFKKKNSIEKKKFQLIKKRKSIN
jgi:hypothetical protein